MSTITILRGLPGSGKSTMARELQKESDGTACIVSRDAIREMMLLTRSPSEASEPLVEHVYLCTIRAVLESGYNVIADATHLDSSPTLAKIHDICRDVGDVDGCEVPINLSVDECIARNLLRKSEAERVPTEIIVRMAKRCGIYSGSLMKPRTFSY